jgi:peptidoglycan/LPS O-acetylase OafA/YrhL
VVDQHARSSAAVRGKSELGFRGDIEGLRGVAVLLIVGFHVGLRGFGGGFIGVDVFFVISGYLITRLLLRWIDHSEPVSPLTFWARRVRRLVPALAVVIVVVIVVGMVFVYSPLAWPNLSRQGAASALYVSNVLFARQATDYFAPALRTSPFLHTWSLGVEEQFYLVWPLLFLVPARVARRAPDTARRLLVLVLTLVTSASFVLSFVLSRRGSPWAYFSSPTRAWEFGLAGLVAILGWSGARFASRVWPFVAWSGLVGIVAATVTFDPRLPYPGVAAIVPVLGTIALLLPGEHALRYGPAVVLRRPTMRWLGRVSYSWYLWHWPLIVFIEVRANGASTMQRLGAALIALALAAASLALVEDPVRFSRKLAASRRRSFQVGIAITAAAILTASSAAVAARIQQRDPLLQRLEAARTFDVPCARVENGNCIFGDPTGKRTLLLIGDSHAVHWIPPIALIAREKRYRLIARGRGGCPVVATVTNKFTGRRDPICDTFNSETLRMISAMHPAAVIIANSTAYRGQILDKDGHVLSSRAAQRAWQRGYTKLLRFLVAEHIPALVALDGPVLDFDPMECIAQRRSTASCAPSRSEALRTTGPLNDAERNAVRDAHYGWLYDPTPVICDDRQCKLEIGDVLVYADPDHLTGQFVLTQTAAWRALLNAALANN